MKSNLSYPLSPDTSFESFLIYDEGLVDFFLKGPYSVSDLVPMDYSKIMKDAYSAFPVLPFAPLREISYIQGPSSATNINNETGLLIQSTALKNNLARAYQYYTSQIVINPNLKCPLGVATEMQEEILGPHNLAGSDVFYIRYKLKINWFVIPGSLFS